MLYYLTKRLGLSAMVIGLVVLVLFSLLYLIPGDPATIALGPRATPEAIARYAEKMHLDEPVWRQFLIYIGNALTGDLGLDVFSDRPVTAIIMERIGFTLALVCAGMGWAMTAGHPAGLPRGGAAQQLAGPDHRRPVGGHHRGAVVPRVDLGAADLCRAPALAAGHRRGRAGR